MRCRSAISLLGLLWAGPFLQAKDTPRPAPRSFRPVVPIKQNVRDGAAPMNQSVKFALPSSPDLDEPAPEPPAAPEYRSLKDEAAPASLPAPSAGEETPERDLPSPESVDTTPGGSQTPSQTAADATSPKGPTLTQLREAAHRLAGRKLSYVFGADDPDSGGLDCSSCIQLLLTEIGVRGVPRTSYDQYYWLKKKNLLDDVYGKSPSSKLLKKLSPGDLIFWGGTWKSGHRVSHVMLYMGYNPESDKHYVFGARSKNTTGLTGSGVDIFELDTERGRLVAHGKIPGLVYQ